MTKDGREVKIRGGIVLSFNGSTLILAGPNGPIMVIVSDATEVQGDLDSAREVRVEGELQDNGTILAAKVEVRC